MVILRAPLRHVCRLRKISAAARDIAKRVVTVPNSPAYNSLWQVKNDTWSSLEESTTQLALADDHQRPAGQLAETVTELLDVLGSIERFWAFPGAQTYQEVQRLFSAGEYDRLAAGGSRANR